VSYSSVFKDHIARPRNSGELHDANAVAEQTNPVCGDRLRLSLRIRAGQVDAARFLAYGCPATIACGSAITTLIEGKPVKAAMKLSRRDLIEALDGLPARKQHAAALAIETLRTAIEAGCSDLINT